MIKGKHWPIDNGRIGDGFGLSLKNSKKLLNVAIEQLDKIPPIMHSVFFWLHQQ